MSPQWFPGHMTKARREMAASMPTSDVVIEVLDARMPVASSNPVVTELRAGKPCLKILNKSDLADPAVTAAWLRAFESSPHGNALAIASCAKQAGEARARVPELCATLAPRTGGSEKAIRVLVVGIPNVGKSTLINTLAGRKVARVGDEPAVTKGQQQVILAGGVVLSDNPGILWPKIDDEAAASALALGGAIPDVAIEYEIVGLFAAKLLLARYPERLRARYGLAVLPSTGEALLAEIGRRRGCLRAGGAIDLHKAADALIHDFRAGKLGRISLETPSADES